MIEILILEAGDIVPRPLLIFFISVLQKGQEAFGSLPFLFFSFQNLYISDSIQPLHAHYSITGLSGPDDISP